MLKHPHQQQKKCILFDPNKNQDNGYRYNQKSPIHPKTNTKLFQKSEKVIISNLTTDSKHERMTEKLKAIAEELDSEDLKNFTLKSMVTEIKRVGG